MSEEDLVQDFLEDCKGTGTKEDPNIIDNIDDFFYYNHIVRESKHYINVINCDFRDYDVLISLFRNLTIKNCKFKNCSIYICSDVFLIESSFKGKFSLERTHNITIDNCVFRKFSLTRCYNCYVKDCGFDKFSIKISRGNVFENNKIKEKMLTKDNINPSSIKKFFKTLLKDDLFHAFLLSFSFLIFFSLFIINLTVLGFSFFSIFLIILITSILSGFWMYLHMYFRRISKDIRSYETGNYKLKDIKKLSSNKII